MQSIYYLFDRNVQKIRRDGPENVTLRPRSKPDYGDLPQADKGPAERDSVTPQIPPIPTSGSLTGRDKGTRFWISATQLQVSR
jgi:hypothetical protein